MKTKWVKAGVAAGVIALTPFSQAYAEAMASAVVKFYDFRIFGSQLDTNGDLIQLDASDFDPLNYKSTADADAQLQGTSESYQGALDIVADGDYINFPDFPSGAIISPAGADLCLGDCSGTLVGPDQNDDEFYHIKKTDVDSDGTGDYAWADQKEEGAPISGLTYVDENGDTQDVPSDADVANSSYAKVASGSGGANSDNGLNSDFEFLVNSAQDFLQIEFNLSALAYAYMDANEEGLASASAFYSLNVYETGDATTSFTWAPVINGTVVKALQAGQEFLCPLLSGDPQACLADLDQLGFHSLLTSTPGSNFTVSVLSGLDEETLEILNQNVAFRTIDNTFNTNPRTFVSGTSYTLSARIETSVEVLLVPVPAPLALMGIGLAALGAASNLARRRRRQE